MPKAFFFALKFLERTTGHMHVPQSAQINTCGEVIFEGAFLFQISTLSEKMIIFSVLERHFPGLEHPFLF